MRVDPTVLDDEQRARLSGTRFGPIVQLGETPSTNLEAMGRARTGADEGLVVVADYQTAGRGRFDRRWESPPGMSLLASVLLRPSPADLPAARLYLAMAAVSVAVTEGAVAVSGARLGLKWPNDVVAAGEGAGAKVAGVLAETAGVPVPGIVVGFGLNVGWAPAGMEATCLEALAGHPVERGDVLVESLLALDRLYGSWDEVADRYRRSCTTLGREVVVRLGTGPGPGTPSGPGPVPGPAAQGEEVRGVAVDIDLDGRLVVRTSSGERVAVAAGDVFHARSAPPSNLSGQ